MAEREKKCFDSHPIWKVAADELPVEDGEYLVVVESLNKLIRYVEICDYDKKHKIIYSLGLL